MVNQIGDIFNGLIVTPINSVVAGVADWFAGLLGWRTSTTSQVISVTSQVAYVQQIIHVSSDRPLHDGIDPTGDGSLSFDAIDDDISVVANTARWGFIRMRTAVEKKTISFMASKTGTVTGFWADVYKLENDGSVTLVHSSPDLSSGLANVNSWMNDALTTSVVVDIMDVYAVQFSMTGSGTVIIPGKVLRDAVALPGFRPKHLGASRNPSTTRAPATIAVATVDGMYNGTAPYVQMGMDLGQLDQPRFHYDDYNRSTIGANWILLRDGGATGNLRIYDNRLAYANATDGNNYGLWIQPTLTDRTKVAGNFYLPRYTPSMLIMHSTYNLSASARFYIYDTKIQIRTGTTIREEVARSGNAGTWEFEFDDTDSTYRAYRDGSATPLIEWPDPTNIAARGDGHRYVGVAMTRNTGTDSAYIDNWIGRDW